MAVGCYDRRPFLVYVRLLVLAVCRNDMAGIKNYNRIAENIVAGIYQTLQGAAFQNSVFQPVISAVIIVKGIENII